LPAVSPNSPPLEGWRIAPEWFKIRRRHIINKHNKIPYSSAHTARIHSQFAGFTPANRGGVAGWSSRKRSAITHDGRSNAAVCAPHKRNEKTY